MAVAARKRSSAKGKPRKARKREVTSYTLGAEDRAFIQAQVAEGLYSNASAVVRAALTSFRESDAKERAWSSAIQAGLDSPVDPRSARDVAAAIRARHFK